MYGQTASTPAAQATVRKGPGGGAFTLTPPTQAGGSRGMLAVSGTGALDTVLAIQDHAAAHERRRRTVRRGHSVLDQLEELRVCLLEGAIDPTLLSRLRHELASSPELVDPDLRSVMAEIEVRATVEMAKLEAAGVTR